MAKDCSLHLGPRCTLLFFTLANVLIYLDRGVISAILTVLSTHMHLEEGSVGALGSVFMLGFMVSSPIFAFSAQYVAPVRLVAVGLLLWSLATLSAGLSLNYAMLMVSRAATGIGEASLVCLAPPLILDSAPTRKKTVIPTQLWISVFYSAMTIGYALGFVYGNETMTLIGSWRAPLLIESAVMIPLIFIAFFLKFDSHAVETAEENRTSIGKQLISLGKNPVFILIVAGYSAYAFTVGGLAFWGNNIIQVSYGVSPRLAVVSLGGMTVFCGVVATVLGSVYMDYLLEPIEIKAEIREISEKALQYHRTEVACRLASQSITFGAVLGTVGALFRSFPYFITALSASEFLLFLYSLRSGTGPVGVAVMSSVPSSLRGQANALAVFFMHLFGDFPSPYIVGLVNQFVGTKWGMMMLVSWLFVGAVAWTLAWVMAVTARQRGKRQTEEKGGREEEEEKLVV